MECKSCKAKIGPEEDLKEYHKGYCYPCFAFLEAEAKRKENDPIIKALAKRISDLEQSNANLGWKLGELETQIAEIRKPIIETGITKEIVQEWIAVLRKAEKDHLVELDHADCGDLADILDRMLEIMY